MNARALPGLGLIAGSIGFLTTMALHPARISTSSLARDSHIMAAVHALGLLSIPEVVFGLMGFSTHAGWWQPSTQFAFVSYCLAIIAAMIAGLPPASSVRHCCKRKRESGGTRRSRLLEQKVRWEIQA